MHMLEWQARVYRQAGFQGIDDYGTCVDIPFTPTTPGLGFGAHCLLQLATGTSAHVSDFTTIHVHHAHLKTPCRLDDISCYVGCIDNFVNQASSGACQWAEPILKQLRWPFCCRHVVNLWCSLPKADLAMYRQPGSFHNHGSLQSSSLHIILLLFR